jgi:tRNA threonylcarbamoyl adenosine modification protein (Sua5/YciO/YrdC/YwlC family)
MLLEINPENPQPRLIKKVVEQLHGGAIICYPTDTVYGIGCDIFNQKAIKRIFQLKNRPKHKPFSFICADLKDVSKYAHVSNLAYRVMKKSLPGPFTFVLPGSKLVPKIMITKQKTVGIRVPDNRISIELVAALGNPILTTSAIPANGEGMGDDPYDIHQQFGKVIDIVIDGGPVYPDPSTVVSFVNDPPEVLRRGKGDIDQFLITD